MKKSKPKVGDMVRINEAYANAEKGTNWHERYSELYAGAVPGDVGVVVSVWRDKENCTVRWLRTGTEDNGGVQWYEQVSEG